MKFTEYMDVFHVLINFPFCHVNKVTIGWQVVEEIWEPCVPKDLEIGCNPRALAGTGNIL